MKKRAWFAFFILVILLLPVCGVHFGKVAEANFIPFGTITIDSPANQTTYTSRRLTLNISIVFSVTPNKWVGYSIDRQAEVEITGLTYSGETLWETASTSVPLPELPNGSHRLEVYAKTGHTTVLPGTGYVVVYFTIDSTEEFPSKTISPATSPTPSLSPSKSPNTYSSPTPSPNSTPNENQSSSPTLSPNPSLSEPPPTSPSNSPKTSPTPSTSESPTPSPTPSEKPAQSPEQQATNFPMELIYAAAAVAIVVVAVMLWKRR